jgi:hypothetical protein
VIKVLQPFSRFVEFVGVVGIVGFFENDLPTKTTKHKIALQGDFEIRITARAAVRC